MPSSSSTGSGYFEVKLYVNGSVSGTDIINSVQTKLSARYVPMATIALLDGDVATNEFDQSKSATYNPGTEIELKAGYKGALSSIFKGVVVKHTVRATEYSSLLILECKHAAHELTVGRKSRVFTGQSDSQIFSKILTDNGLSSALNFSGSSVTSEQVLQFDVTDWDFLMLRAELNSKWVYCDGSTIQVKDPPSSLSGSKTYTYGKDVYAFEGEIDAATQLKKVEVTSWDPATQASISASKQSFQLEHLGSVSGVKKSDLEDVASPTIFAVPHGGQLSAAECEALAESQQMVASLSKVNGRMKIKGDETVAVGDIIKVVGFGKFSGSLLVTGVQHDLSESGWTTTLQFGSSKKRFVDAADVSGKAGAGVVAGIQGLQVGVVEKIEGDTEQRIEISLPIAGEDVKLLARMLFPSAGSKRGFQFWPEVKDEVVVGFLHNDPSFPVILGAVFSSKNKPDIIPTKENAEKGYISKSDLRLVFQEEDKSITLSTPEGYTVVLDETKKAITATHKSGSVITIDDDGVTIDSKGKVSLKAADDIELSSSGGGISLDGQNIDITASAKVSVDGSSGIDCKSSANVTIKGSMVDIN